MPTISESVKGKIKIAVNYCDHNPPHICMVRPANGRKVDCYFTTGHVKRFDMAPFLKPDCGPVFKPLRNRKTFLSTMTVMNNTLAFDIAGGRNDRKCVDIDPETIFEEGQLVVSPY